MTAGGYVDGSAGTWVAEHLLLCAGCGAVVWCDRAELDELRLTMCEFCKAPLSSRACPVFHSFGSCTECSVDELGECPFDAPDSAPVVDPAMERV